MSTLLKRIKNRDSEAADALKEAGFCTNSEIHSLTREDLREVFPGLKEVKRRKIISEIIQEPEPRPIDELLKEVKDFIPHESLRAALTDNGVLVNYLHTLKHMKTQMDNVQAFLEAHINLLEDIRKTEPNQEQDFASARSTSATDGPVELQNHQTADDQLGADGSNSTNPDNGGPMEPYQTQRADDQPGADESRSIISGNHGPVVHNNHQTPDDQAGAHGSNSTNPANGGPMEPYQTQTADDQPGADGSRSTTPATGDRGKPRKNRTDSQKTRVTTVNYEAVVSGKTFNAEVQLLDKIMAPVGGRKLQLVASSTDSQVIFVFCPIVSRLATDVNAALADVKVDKPVILVLMHHTHQTKCVAPHRTWEETRHVVLHVNVFYHEKIPGLLKCKENEDAVSQIQKNLLPTYSSEHTSAGTQDESGSLTGRGDDNSDSNPGSDNSTATKPWWKFGLGNDK